MTKIHFFTISLAVFLSVQLHAGMKQTDACNAQIRKLESEITSLKGEVPPSLTIPEVLRKLKQSNLNTKINCLENDIALLKKNLKRYKTITIRRIEINAFGKWDTFSAPEIRVKMGNSVIAEGKKDTENMNSQCFEDATNHDTLVVYDVDATGEEHMGSIPLKKGEIPLGVSGDSFISQWSGNVSKESSLSFSYTVEYEVEY